MIRYNENMKKQHAKTINQTFSLPLDVSKEPMLMSSGVK